MYLSIKDNDTLVLFAFFKIVHSPLLRIELFWLRGPSRSCFQSVPSTIKMTARKAKLSILTALRK